MLLTPGDVPTMTFDWGSIKWLVTPAGVPGAGSTLGEVIVNPGRGHARHNHPGAEEVIYVISGEATQMVDDKEPFTIREGDAVHIPKGAWHSTHNTTWRPLRLIGDVHAGRRGEGAGGRAGLPVPRHRRGAGMAPDLSHRLRTAPAS